MCRLIKLSIELTREKPSCESFLDGRARDAIDAVTYDALRSSSHRWISVPRLKR